MPLKNELFRVAFYSSFITDHKTKFVKKKHCRNIKIIWLYFTISDTKYYYSIRYDTRVIDFKFLPFIHQCMKYSLNFNFNEKTREREKSNLPNTIVIRNMSNTKNNHMFASFLFVLININEFI